MNIINFSRIFWYNEHEDDPKTGYYYQCKPCDHVIKSYHYNTVTLRFKLDSSQNI